MIEAQTWAIQNPNLGSEAGQSQESQVFVGIMINLVFL